jgi:hypothetical protein
MEAELIKEKIALYKKRELPWIELASTVEQARQDGKDYKYFVPLGIQEKTYRILIRAYRFLSVRRLLDHEIKAGAETVGLLPAAYRRMKISEEDFDKLVMEVLSGKISLKKLSKLSRGITERPRAGLDSVVRESFKLHTFIKNYAIDKLGSSEVIKIMHGTYQHMDESMSLEDAFSYGLNILEALTTEVLEKIDRKELKKKFGTLCHDLAIELECIADEDFHEAQNEKESFKI